MAADIPSAAASPRDEGVGTSGEGLRVLIADDHAMTRAGVRLALERAGFEICAEAQDGPSAVEAAVREHPDICLLDVRMRGSGIYAAEQIGRRVPDAAIVMLTVSRADADLSTRCAPGRPAICSRTSIRSGSRSCSAGCSRATRRCHGIWSRW